MNAKNDPPSTPAAATSTPAAGRLPVVVLTNPIHPDGHALLAQVAQVRLAASPRADDIRAAIADADGLVVRAQLPDDLFDSAPRLRAVVRHGVGLDMIPMDAATRRRIPVANVPGANTSAVVEYCLAAMLALRRPLVDVDRGLRQQGWAAAQALAAPGGELAGGTCGIVGVGAIGQGVARAAAALGMKVLGLTRRPQTLPAGVIAADRRTLFADSDVVVLCCPLNEQTRGLVDAALMATMRPHALLINVARGPVVNTAALIDALIAGRLGGAACDVHEQQPLLADHPVFSAPRLLLTPHIAGITVGSLRRMSLGAVDAMTLLLRGERPATLVNPQVLA